MKTLMHVKKILRLLFRYGLILCLWLGLESRNDLYAQELGADPNTSLLLRFNNSLNDIGGETPVVQSGFTYTTGIWSEGVSIPSVSSLQYAAAGNIDSQTGTLETWLKPSWTGKDGQSHWILSWGGGGGILLGKDGGNNLRGIFNRFGGGGGSEVGVSVNVGNWVSNTWYHVVYTWSSTRLNLYINGQRVYTTALSVPLPTISATNFQIGGDGAGGALEGALDEFRISNVVRTSDEVIQSFWQGLLHRVSITGLTVSPAGVQLAVGNHFAFSALASTSDGGTYPASSIVTWSSSDTNVATVNVLGNVTGMQTGGATIQASLGGQTGSQTLAVIPPLSTPSFTAIPFKTTVRLVWGSLPANAAGVRIYRSLTSGGTATLIRTSGAYEEYTDYNLSPNTTYYYTIEYDDRYGNDSPRSAEVSVTTNNYTYLKIASLDLLMPIYTGGRNSAETQRLVNTIPLMKAFYFRNSLGKLNLNILPMVLEGDAPLEGAGTVSTFASISADLVSKKIRANQFDAVHAFAKNTLGCFGSGVILGSTGMSTSHGACNAMVPSNDVNYRYGDLWAFVHEFGHSFDSPIAHGSGFPDLPFNHFPWAYPMPSYANPFDAGAHFDGMALILRTFPNHLNFQAPWDGYIEVEDQDQDGLADNDMRVSMDEARFTSNVNTSDTDNDRLSDLAEYHAGMHFSTDPNAADTDLDGMLDGADVYPLSNFKPHILATTSPVTIDGSRQTSEGWQLLSSNAVFSAISGLSLNVYATWDAQYLYLSFESNALLKYYLGLDASGLDGTHTTAVKFTSGDYVSGDNGINGQSYSDTYNDDAALVIRSDDTQVYLRNSPLAGSAVQTTQTGGVYITEVRIPQHLPPGRAWAYAPATAVTAASLPSFQVGDWLGFELYARRLSETSGHDPLDWMGGSWVSVAETYHFYDAQLMEANTGALQVTKSVTGAPIGFVSPSFSIVVDCSDDRFDQTLLLTHGGSQTISNIPVGTTCTISEPSQPAPPTGYHYETPTISPSGAQTIGLANTTAVAVTNPLAVNLVCSINGPTIATTCNDNGTAINPADDTFTFTIRTTGTNTSATYKVDKSSPAPIATLFPSLNYGTTSAASSSFPISGGALTLTLTDNATSTCTRTSVTVTPPAPCSTAPPGQPDLKVLKTASATSVNAGQTLTYTITLTNEGTASATGVQLRDVLPASVTLVSATPSQGTYTAATGIWNVGTVTVGAVLTLTIIVTIN